MELLDSGSLLPHSRRELSKSLPHKLVTQRDVGSEVDVITAPNHWPTGTIWRCAKMLGFVNEVKRVPDFRSVYDHLSFRVSLAA